MAPRSTRAPKSEVTLKDEHLTRGLGSAIEVSTTATQPSPALAKSSISLLTHVNGLAVSDRKSADEAGKLLQQLKTLLDGIEKERLFFTKPLVDQQRAINTKFKVLTEPLAAADKQLRAKVVLYKQQEEQSALQARLQAEQAARLMEEKRQLAERAKGKAKDKALAAFTQAENAATEATQGFLDASPQAIGGVSGVKRWTFEVTDVSKVPREYLELDGSKVREAIKEGARDIPGLRIYENVGLAVGRGT